MGYDSVSSIVVLALIVIGILGWLPRRTFKSMNKVVEHREDRFSPSLHLIDADSSKRFSDGRTTVLKGMHMQPGADRGSGLSRERIEKIRRLRRQAAARRRMVVLGLLLIGATVLIASVALHFSSWYVLVPLGLVAVALLLGVRASRHARAWESRVQQTGLSSVRGRSPDRSAKVEHGTDHGHKGRVPNLVSNPGKASAASSGKSTAGKSTTVKSTTADETATRVLERREIRRALHDASEHATLHHRPQTAEVRETITQHPAQPEILRQGVATPNRQTVVNEERRQPAGTSQTETSPDGTSSDSTAELSRVTASRPLDVFDTATSPPELISFSLGGSRTADTQREVERRSTTRQGAHGDHGRDGQEPQSRQEPQSLEIRSTRQVARAVAPSRQHHASQLGDQPATESAKQGVQDVSATPRDNDGDDVRTFHRTEEQADVDVPAPTEDSLGANLVSILARRASKQ